MRVSFATEPGSPSKPNEDFVQATPRVVAVLDGLGTPGGLPTGCVHGTPWFVAQLGGQLVRLASDHPAQDLQDVATAAIEAVAAAHADTCDLDHPGTPSSSITLLRAGEETVDYLVVHDSVIVLDGPDGQVVVSDLRSTSVAQQEHLDTEKHLIGTPEHDESLRRLVVAQQPHRNTTYWVAASKPETAKHALTGSLPRSAVQRAALLTDGAAAYVETYGLADWAATMDLLDRHGPAELVARVRETESTDPHGSQWPRYKRSDDATAAFCLL
ncbi:protein phosphatase 2C domain-containing protein [Lentzea terrae]|uniref:protein phosphatase 2C domain-containing protein n=1 Tax=Lentzea terrae TaxID=2200761 RepID=UPI0013002B4A|nr:protein phosphatase 2C domain-containing protein [Lentzea terrae]